MAIGEAKAAFSGLVAIKIIGSADDTDIGIGAYGRFSQPWNAHEYWDIWQEHSSEAARSCANTNRGALVYCTFSSVPRNYYERVQCWGFSAVCNACIDKPGIVLHAYTSKTNPWSLIGFHGVQLSAYSYPLQAGEYRAGRPYGRQDSGKPSYGARGFAKRTLVFSMLGIALLTGGILAAGYSGINIILRSYYIVGISIFIVSLACTFAGIAIFAEAIQGQL